jgi:hypothetical protein
MPIDLTGKYVDADARPYVVMQDDVQRTDRSAFIAFLRVMRERDEIVRSGTIHISDETFTGAGADDQARNGAIAAALVTWIVGRDAVDRFFQLRARAGAGGPAPAVEMLDEHRPASST